MNARSKEFWRFQGIFWSVAGAALFLSGLSQADPLDAFVRNLFLFIVGFLTSFFLAMVVDELRWLSMLRLRLVSYSLAYVVALFCTVVINAISNTMLGIDFGDMTLGRWAAGALNLGLVYAFWTELFIQQIYQERPATNIDAPRRIVVEHRGDLVPVETAEIESVTAAGDYVEILCDGRTYLDRQTLRSIEDLLGEGFVRVHRSALINRSKVASVTPLNRGRYRINLASGASVSTSRGYSDVVRAEFLT